MLSFSHIITDETGLLGRPASILVKECSEYISDISIICKGKQVDAKRIIGIMSLGAKKDDILEILVNGEDETKAINSLKRLFKEHF